MMWLLVSKERDTVVRKWNSNLMNYSNPPEIVTVFTASYGCLAGSYLVRCFEKFLDMHAATMPGKKKKQ